MVAVAAVPVVVEAVAVAAAGKSLTRRNFIA
jgi:hypothetical protein